MTLSIQDLARTFREAGNVARCHTLPHHGNYSVASHSWHALALLFLLHPQPSHALIWSLAFHDVAERFFGDQPTQAGWANPALREAQKEAEATALRKLGATFPLTADDEQWLSCLDKLELLLWCEDQMALGNKHVENCAGLVRGWFRTHWEKVPAPIASFISTFIWRRGSEQLP